MFSRERDPRCLDFPSVRDLLVSVPAALYHQFCSFTLALPSHPSDPFRSLTVISLAVFIISGVQSRLRFCPLHPKRLEVRFTPLIHALPTHHPPTLLALTFSSNHHPLLPTSSFLLQVYHLVSQFDSLCITTPCSGCTTTIHFETTTYI